MGAVHHDVQSPEESNRFPCKKLNFLAIFCISLDSDRLSPGLPDVFDNTLSLGRTSAEVDNHRRPFRTQRLGNLRSHKTASAKDNGRLTA